ncbi:amidohydrolase [Nocardioides sp. DS6]|uniref:Amidohydrolase n=1 Tax=Nocardioides eburneus TaxID=3231482 RepID=A0ABV3T0P0_9ACTN
MILDALYLNGRIRTGTSTRPMAHTLGVFDGVVVGLDEEVSGLRARRVVDLGGAPAVPGLHDAHHHLSGRGQALLSCDVSPRRVRTLQELYAALADHVVGLPGDAWVRAHGYDESTLGGHPLREALDAAVGGRPLLVLHRSHHSGIVNTPAIRLVGGGHPDGLPEIDGGTVERRPDGTPTGYLTERAWEFALAGAGPISSADMVRAIGLASAAALADGLTSITEPGISGSLTGNGPADLGAFLTARDQGLRGPRITVMPEMAALHEMAGSERDLPGFGLDLGLRTGLGDDRLRIGAVKIFGDGALSSRTASLRCPYHGEPDNTGLAHPDPDQLRTQVLAAHRTGWQIATHAIGDAAVDVALGAYEAAQETFPRPDARHRIEHCGVADDETIKRLAAHGVIPVPQGRFLTEFGATYLEAVGPERGDLLYRQRSFLDAGIELPGSSDCPVVDGAPLLGIQALVTRVLDDGRVLNPAERLTPVQALRAYTYGSAYADHQEHRKGTLQRGRLADLVVLSDDLLEVAPERIETIDVVATVVGGEALFGADNLKEL